MPKILFVLKKNGLNEDVYNSLQEYFDRYGCEIDKSFFITFDNKEKFCKTFYPEKFEKYAREIQNSFSKQTLALIVRIPRDQYVKNRHIGIKGKIRERYGFDTIHCSDTKYKAKKEIQIILDPHNKATFVNDGYKRYEEKRLLRQMR
jgi:nucleoside diphosphate kinase